MGGAVCCHSNRVSGLMQQTVTKQKTCNASVKYIDENRTGLQSRRGGQSKIKKKQSEREDAVCTNTQLAFIHFLTFH